MIGILILNFNNSKDTIECIKSIMAYTTISYKLLVVDNGSSKTDDVVHIEKFLNQQGSYKRLDSSSVVLEKFNFLVSKTNDGYAQGNNKGLIPLENDADIDKILILNNDILFTDDIMPTLLDVLEQDSSVGVVCPLLKKRNNVSIDFNCARKCISVKNLGLIYLLAYRNMFGLVDRVKRNSLIFKANQTLLSQKKVEIELPSGSCMMFRKEVLQEINNFDPNTFLYFEENILFRKLQEHGYKNYILPQISCIHLGASTTAKSQGSFIHACGIKSAKYYVDNYSGAPKWEKALFRLGYSVMKVKISLLKILGR